MAESTGLDSAERMKFFTDAVVAIAMTLLILPLLESVSEAAKDGVDTATFLGDHGDQIFAFVLSFVIIARFWVSHERLFDSVERWTGWLMVLNIAVDADGRRACRWSRRWSARWTPTACRPSSTSAPCSRTP